MPRHMNSAPDKPLDRAEEEVEALHHVAAPLVKDHDPAHDLDESVARSRHASVDFRKPAPVFFDEFLVERGVREDVIRNEHRPLASGR